MEAYDSDMQFQIFNLRNLMNNYSHLGLDSDTYK